MYRLTVIVWALVAETLGLASFCWFVKDKEQI